jgi:hypothetical protein
MPDHVTEGADDPVAADLWLQQTALYRAWSDMKQEILLHKWYESERAGFDIGWDRAAVDWMVRYGCRRRG